MKRHATLILLLWTLALNRSAAHDPYEITSVVYVRSNVIEIFVEMEFPAGMNLAGIKPAREIAAADQFQAALPRLRELAGSFFTVTAGNNFVAPQSTNVTLGVEDHIRFELNLRPSTFRPLKFVARGLGNGDGENPYGTSLTVLDMVNQKVLGQATLFASSPTADFPPQSTESVSEPPTNEPSKVETILPAAKPSPILPVAQQPAPAINWAATAAIVIVAVGCLVVWLRKVLR